MKKLVIKISIMAAMVSATLILPLIVPLPYNDTLSIIINKYDLLKKTPSPRIVVLGGSGIYGGFDSSIAAKEFGKNTVNLSLYAGYGILPALYVIERFAENGDIVILVPEYCMIFDQDYDCNELGKKWLLAGDPSSMVKHYYLNKPFLLIKDLTELLTAKLDGLRKSITRGKKSIFSKGYYKFQVMNEHGDLICDFKKFPEDKLIGKETKFNKSKVKQESIDRLNSFADAIKSKGGSAYYFFPAFPEAQYNKNKEIISKFFIELKENLTMPIVGKPADFVYPNKYFLDSVYHINSEARELRTKKVIKMLKAEMRRQLKNRH